MNLTRIRVLLADDHHLFREGLANLLNTQPDLEVVGEAADGLEVLVKARKLKPKLILMDIGMPGCDGVEATQRIMQELPDTVIVILTVRNEDEHLFRAIQSGAQGYLLKNIRSQDLIAMIRRAVNGEAAITPALGARMLEEFRRLSRRPSMSSEDQAETLTGRGKEVLSLVAQGASDQEIARQLVISIHTVKSHMRNILSKLHLSHRHDAAQYALREGLIRTPPADIDPHP
jgi:DNA-binding NarL/FixJ family response regulator